MARTKGSKNIPKTSNNLQVLKFDKQIEGSPITRNSSQGWVNWGVDNLYPNKLLNLYNESPTHRAAINFGVQSIVGAGVSYEESNFDGKEIVPNYTQSWDELIRNISLDYLLYGSYAVEVIMNKDGKTLSYYHMPLDKVRWSEYDEDGQILNYWISNDWSATGQYPPFEIEAFDMRPDTKIEKGKPYLYVYRQYSPAMTYYTQPHYQAGIKAIQSEIEYCNYDNKFVTNGFTSPGVLTVNDTENDDEKRAIIKNIQNLFTGTENANSFAIAFRRSPDEKPVEWTPFSNTNSNVNIYDAANLRTINRILSAHQINDPQLIGLPNLGATAFNSEGKLLETAYNVYNKVVGNYNRQCVIKTFNMMLALNGIETEIVMKPLRFDIENTESTTTDTSKENADINSSDYNEGNVEEKVEK